MVTHRAPPAPLLDWKLVRHATFPRLRVLAWSGNILYASRGYTLLRADTVMPNIAWEPIARYSPLWWRKLSASSRPTFRLFRDGFHALAALPSGHMVVAVAGAIITLLPGEREFKASHRVLRGTRPLHIAATPNGDLFWGEYFDNRDRDEVHIYASTDRGASWQVAYTFPKRSIRHVHNVVCDPWENCLWILTGDDGTECRILRASSDFRTVDAVLAGNQQTRAVALVVTRDALYFSSDTPLESNYVYSLDRRGNLTRLAAISGSSIFGCRVGEATFFSTMVEPSGVNEERNVRIYGSLEGEEWRSLVTWPKDSWPMGLFQFGNAIFPDGDNGSRFLALTTVAVRGADLETSLWTVA